MTAYSHKAGLLSLVLALFFTFGPTAIAADVKIHVKPGTKVFTPQHLKIKAGDTVTWVNEDQEEHYLTSAGPSTLQVVLGTENLMMHKPLPTGASYDYTFTEPETYHYFCGIHAEMWGTVIVEK